MKQMEKAKLGKLTLKQNPESRQKDFTGEENHKENLQKNDHENQQETHEENLIDNHKGNIEIHHPNNPSDNSEYSNSESLDNASVIWNNWVLNSVNVTLKK